MTENENYAGCHFIDNNGTFQLEEPHKSSYLYFPMANEAGMMSSITPLLRGDIKSDQNSFLMTPVSQDDLHNSRSSRNFWILINSTRPWSAVGNSSWQTVQRFDTDQKETVRMEGGFLWHRIIRENSELNLRAEITNFVPVCSSKIELMQVKITNTGKEEVVFTPTAAIPIYGRSADNLRDHRHVTSLLNRIFIVKNGVQVRPVLSFDERGHKLNNTTYFVLSADGRGAAPEDFFATIEDFIGEGGCLEWPEAVVKNKRSNCVAGTMIEGYEAIGALKFKAAALAASETVSYVVAMGISDNEIDADELAGIYCTEERFNYLLEENKKFWQSKLDTLAFTSRDEDFAKWMKWVTLQPILRRIYGCSFLPHHDYGRGGRGWRDLWQDCLALLLMEPTEVRSLLLNNFAGVRVDGSNATIIGSKPGEFIADRNNIPRVWMDHGAWPFLTTQLYINQSGDLEFLLEEQVYFKDKLICRSKQVDSSWNSENGNMLLNSKGEVYKGSILEHLLLQNLVQFFNVGDNNNILLEGADWNDALDMAPEKGESVAFTALYASNLAEIAALLCEVESKLGIKEIKLLSEITVLLDSLNGLNDYTYVDYKHKILDSFYSLCRNSVSGDKVVVRIEELVKDLECKAQWITNHIREHEWIKNGEGAEWYNGYYDNIGRRVEGDSQSGVRMTLTGQVFTIMGGIATDEQVAKIAQSVDRYLKSPEIGYRLNTNFGGMQPKLGRAFGFAFGHKENGAMFSHMAVMYANALYKRNFAKEGYEVLESIYRLCNDFEKSRIYPGIPEYINEKGRGMYNYLTGSASWLLLTYVQEVYGVKGRVGNLVLEPKLVESQFDQHGEASVTTLFAGRMLKVVYKNPTLKDFGEYEIDKIYLDGSKILSEGTGTSVSIERRLILEQKHRETHILEVWLT